LFAGRETGLQKRKTGLLKRKTGPLKKRSRSPEKTKFYSNVI